MEDKLDMSDLQEQSSTLNENRNPKIILASLLFAVAGLAIFLGLIFSDNDNSSPDSISEGIPVTEITAQQSELRSSEVETDNGNGDSLREKGTVEIFGEPIPIDAEIGYLAPSFKAQLNDGSESITIDPADGKVRLIGFFAHWCPHCQREVPRVTQWLEENGVPTEIEILAVSTAVREGTPNYPPSEWFIKERWPTDIFVDNEDNDLATAFGLAGFPYWVLVDATGRVMHRSSGELSEEQFGYLVELAISLTPQIT